MAGKRFHNLNLDNFEAPIKATENTEVVEKNDVEEKKASTVKELAQKVSSDSTVNTAFNFKFIPREKIVFYHDNSYPMETIEKVAKSILHDGIIHNLEVFYNEEDDTYVVDTGEQRTRALDLLIARYKDHEDDSREYKLYKKWVKPFETSGYPCKVIFRDTEDIEEFGEDTAEKLAEIQNKIRNRESNEIGREYDQARTQKKVEELALLYQEREAIYGNTQKINVNKMVGETLSISERQVQKYKSISKLIPELKEKFEKAEISLTDGSNYSVLTEEEQMQIVRLLDNGEGKQKVNELYEELNKLRLDITGKEKQISEIEEKRKAAEEALKAEKANQAELKKQIKAELESSNPNKEEISKLEKQLEDQKEASKHLTKSMRDIIDEKDRQLEALKKSMERKEATVKNEKAESLEVMRAATAIDMAMSELNSSIGFLKDSLKSYSNAYSNVESNEKAPDEFKKQILDLLNKEIKNFK